METKMNRFFALMNTVIAGSDRANILFTMIKKNLVIPDMPSLSDKNQIIVQNLKKIQT